MCTNMFVWLLKILYQTCITFDQNEIIYDTKKLLVFYYLSASEICSNRQGGQNTMGWGSDIL
jgi:hypothetical protein